MISLINSPDLITKPSFQLAWIDAVKFLACYGWQRRNLVIHITDTTTFDEVVHQQVSAFVKNNTLLGLKDVAYTIFPHNLYNKLQDRNRLFRAYNGHDKREGMYAKLMRRPRKGWGTYFRRMTHYEIGQELINQLDNIINAINSRFKINKAAYTILIQKPGSETKKPRGGPCLNYIAVQLVKDDPPMLGLFCVYRNHDFLERAYGNYWALCNLTRFLAIETGTRAGPLTCVSSHAYVDNHKSALLQFIQLWS